MTVVLGWFVGIVDIAQFMPQAWRSLRMRRDARGLRALSVWSWSVATVQAVLWVVYGFATDRLPIAVPNVVIAPVCLMILGLTVRSRGLVTDRREARTTCR